MTELSAEPTLRDPCVAKLLVAPSLRVGHQWVEQAARRGAALLNLAPATPLDVAFELAAPALAAGGFEFCTAGVGPMLIDGLWDVLPGGGYLGRLERTPSVCRALARSLADLRLAGVVADDLADERFEAAAKARDLRALLPAYEAALETHRLIDEAGVVRLALDALAGGTFPAAVLLLVPDLFRPEGLYRDLLEAVPRGHRRGFRVGAADDGADVRRLASLHDPDAVAAAPRGDGSVRFFRALGQANEAREVLRRCLAAGRPLDESEVLCADPDVYVPLFYSVGLAIGDDERLRDGVPMTFADGLPAGLSRPGRALAGWVRWASDGFPQPSLVRLLGDGLFQAGGSGEVSEGERSERERGDPAYLAALLRPLAVGTGGRGYLRKLDEQIAALEARIRNDLSPEGAERAGGHGAGGGADDAGGAAAGEGAERDEEAEADEDEDGAAAGRVGRGRSRLSALRDLRGLVASLLELARPLAAGEPDAALAAAERLLTEAAYAAGELDFYAREALLGAVREMRRWAARLGAGAGFDAAGWLAALAGEVRVLGSGPRPGQLHVASTRSGGHSGRPETFVVGLDDGRFPGAAAQDPVLLDGERRDVSDRLATGSARLSERLADFATLLSRLPGRVTLSWPCRDLADDRDLFPSPTVLAAFRAVTGGDGDLAALESHAGSPASFAPRSAAEALSETELWLDRLARSDAPPVRRLDWVTRRRPHLGRGLLARTRRDSAAFTEFDGYVPHAGRDLDPAAGDGRTVSASGLETAGRCPLAYFFAKGLRVSPPDEPEEDLDRWLGPAEYGSLLHEVFRRFLSEVAAEGGRAGFETHHRRLAAILKETVERYRDEVPPPNPNAFRTRYWRLVEVARAFLLAEERRPGAGRPAYLEASFGLRPVGRGTALDDLAPVALTLPSGRTIRLRGRVDRIDLEDDAGDAAGGPVYSVWDYKTGGDGRYVKAGAPFWKGRVLQNVLYVSLAEAALRGAAGPEAAVSAFGYVFPGGRTAGRRIVWAAESLADGLGLVDAVCRTVAEGAFLPTDDHEQDCRYCDHRPACGDLEASEARSRRTLECAAGGDPGPLRPLLELRPRR